MGQTTTTNTGVSLPGGPIQIQIQSIKKHPNPFWTFEAHSLLDFVRTPSFRDTKYPWRWFLATGAASMFNQAHLPPTTMSKFQPQKCLALKPQLLGRSDGKQINHSKNECTFFGVCKSKQYIYIYTHIVTICIYVNKTYIYIIYRYIRIVHLVFFWKRVQYILR